MNYTGNWLKTIKTPQCTPLAYNKLVVQIILYSDFMAY